MKYDPVEYVHFDRDSVGHFEAHMMDDGWAETKFTHEMEENLMSVELSEFIRLVYHIFKECSDWTKLKKYIKRYGTEIPGDFGTVIAMTYIGDQMDYCVYVDGTAMTIYPYRKHQH